ncbi:RING-finger domain containing protein [Zalerion maritima]|uniref:RING-finger domain containing protein n=1 Tax=Zalerion maritima TaxID=339359 RepID=A0AAD5RXH0_9PEZI|nr:RING-finger domain containing protein [Zalerion maritima]
MESSLSLGPGPMTSGPDPSGGQHSYCPYLREEQQQQQQQQQHSTGFGRHPQPGQLHPFGYRFPQPFGQLADQPLSPHWQSQPQNPGLGSFSHGHTHSHSHFASRTSFASMNNTRPGPGYSFFQYSASSFGNPAMSTPSGESGSAPSTNQNPPFGSSMSGNNESSNFPESRILPAPNPMSFHQQHGGHHYQIPTHMQPPHHPHHQPQQPSQQQQGSQQHPSPHGQEPPSQGPGQPQLQQQQQQQQQQRSSFPASLPAPFAANHQIQNQGQPASSQPSQVPSPSHLHFHHQLPPSMIANHRPGIEEPQQQHSRQLSGSSNGSGPGSYSTTLDFSYPQRQSSGMPEPSTNSAQPQSQSQSRTSQSRAFPQSSRASPSPPLETRRRTYASRNRPPHRLPPVPSAYDMDVEPTARFIEALASTRNPQAAWRAGDTNTLRAHQILRGQATAKKAARSVIASLQSVEMTSLSEEDKSCCICYNEFGIENAEGINEAPLRLPKCKHIFGDHCIKKWFEEKDTCPYCRDKVPSERFLYGGEGATALLRQPPADIVLTLVSGDDSRDSPATRRSPPEDTGDGSRRRTRIRHNNVIRSVHGGRHQPSQPGAAAAPSSGRTPHMRPRTVPSASMPGASGSGPSTTTSSSLPLFQSHQQERQPSQASQAPQSSVTTTSATPNSMSVQSNGHPHTLEPVPAQYSQFGYHSFSSPFASSGGDAGGPRPFMQPRDFMAQNDSMPGQMYMGSSNWSQYPSA